MQPGHVRRMSDHTWPQWKYIKIWSFTQQCENKFFSPSHWMFLFLNCNFWAIFTVCFRKFLGLPKEVKWAMFWPVWHACSRQPKHCTRFEVLTMVNMKAIAFLVMKSCDLTERCQCASVSKKFTAIILTVPWKWGQHVPPNPNDHLTQNSWIMFSTCYWFSNLYNQRHGVIFTIRYLVMYA